MLTHDGVENSCEEARLRCRHGQHIDTDQTPQVLTPRIVSPCPMFHVVFNQNHKLSGADQTAGPQW